MSTKYNFQSTTLTPLDKGTITYLLLRMLRAKNKRARIDAATKIASTLDINSWELKEILEGL